jgi:hypothetical protein
MGLSFISHILPGPGDLCSLRTPSRIAAFAAGLEEGVGLDDAVGVEEHCRSNSADEPRLLPVPGGLPADAPPRPNR